MLRAMCGVLLTIVAGGPADARVPDQTPVRRVLAVYSDSRFVYAAQETEAGLRQTLSAEPSIRIEYFAEFMDAIPFGTAEDRRVFSTFLRDKYRDRSPDVLVAVGRPALTFLLDHRQSLFAGRPIVHVGLADDAVPRSRLDDAVVGLTASSNLVDALDLALRLQPATKHIAVVGGVSASDRRFVAPLLEAVNDLAGRFTFTWLNRHTLEELKSAVARLPPNTVVLFATMFEDAAGRLLVPRDVLETLAPLSAAPFYGSFETFIGYGLVGGVMERRRTTGEEAAGVVLRILHGTPPRAAATGNRSPVSAIVDWRQLRRWSIPERNLPAGTELRFRPPTLWEAFRTQVLVFTAVGMAQLLLIAALAVALQRRRVAEATRQEAERRVAQLRDELAHASRVTLLGELAATLAHEINQPLAAILSNAQATRRWLKGEQPDLAEIRAIVDDIIADDKRAGEIIHRMRTLLKKGNSTRSRFDLSRSIRDVAALLHGELVAANVGLRIEAPETGLLVDGDEIATQQVLLNLMLNGIQSIQDSGAAMRTLRVQAARFDGMARVVVHDTGRGVSEEMRDRLFEPFFTTRRRGLGVGLAICRRIAEAHGGTLDLGPSPGGGATFVLTLPSAAA